MFTNQEKSSIKSRDFWVWRASCYRGNRQGNDIVTVDNWGA